MAETPAGLLARALAADPARPLVTFYDDATGERVELSAATLDNWVAKTANLLVDGCGLDPGGVAAVLVPAHWQTAAVLLGCWRAGVAVTHAGADPVDVAFATPDRVADARAAEVFALGLAPLGAPLREVPAGAADYVVSVRVHGDHFTPAVPVDPHGPALVGLADGGALSHAALVRRAAARAAELDLGPDDRLLVAEPRRPLDWLLAPLAAGASVVLCRNADPAKLADRAAAERVTATLSPSSGPPARS